MRLRSAARIVWPSGHRLRAAGFSPLNLDLCPTETPRRLGRTGRRRCAGNAAGRKGLCGLDALRRLRDGLVPNGSPARWGAPHAGVRRCRVAARRRCRTGPNRGVRSENAAGHRAGRHHGEQKKGGGGQASGSDGSEGRASDGGSWRASSRARSRLKAGSFKTDSISRSGGSASSDARPKASRNPAVVA